MNFRGGSRGRFKLEIMKGNRAITEVILSLNILISFCQVSHPPFKNPGSTTELVSGQKEIQKNAPVYQAQRRWEVTDPYTNLLFFLSFRFLSFPSYLSHSLDILYIFKTCEILSFTVVMALFSRPFGQDSFHCMQTSRTS